MVWSLHNEGLSKWRTACASVVNAEFAAWLKWERGRPAARRVLKSFGPLQMLHVVSVELNRVPGFERIAMLKFSHAQGSASSLGSTSSPELPSSEGADRGKE